MAIIISDFTTLESMLKTANVDFKVYNEKNNVKLISIEAGRLDTVFEFDSMGCLVKVDACDLY
jgi:hypothetical protein